MVKIRLLSVFVFLMLIAGCAGKLQYTPPTMVPTTQNSIKIDKGKEDLWKSIIPALGKSFFVINTLDKSSGIINVSYSGDPEKYVDCGRINSYLRNARGERTYNFPASRAQQSYEVMDMDHGAGLIFVERKMNLEGRINIIIEEISTTTSQITINTKYVLTKSGMFRNVQGASKQFTDTISFVSGQQGSFPGGSGANAGTICQPNGFLEQEILAILTSSIKSKLDKETEKVGEVEKPEIKPHNATITKKVKPTEIIKE